MYEYGQPIVNNSPISLSSVRFQIKHDAPFMDKNNPDIEGPHIHNCYEMYVNVTGEVSFLVNDRLYPLRRGDVVLCKPNAVHHCVYNKSCLTEFFVLWVDAPDSKLFSFAEAEDFSPHLSFDDKTRDKIVTLLYKFNSAVKTEASDFPLKQTALLLQFLSILNDKASLIIDDKSSEVLPDEFQNLLKEFNERFLEFRTVDEFSERFFISPSTLTRWFRKYLHLSPKEYLEAKKLSHAKELLKNGKSVTEAGLETGFFDTSHFIAVFKKKFGETPFTFKKRSTQ